MLHNMTLTVEDEVLVIRVPLNGKPRPSRKFGSHRNRNMVLASTNGSKPLVAPDGSFRSEVVNCSVYRAHDPEIDGPEPPHSELW